MITSDLLNIVY